MKISLLVKYSISYIAIIALSLIIFNTYGVSRIEKAMTENRLEILSQEANVIADGYMKSFYRGNSPLSSVKSELMTIDNLANARIWIVSRARNILLDTRQNDVSDLVLTEEFLSRDSSDYIFEEGLVDEPMICIVHPVHINLDLKGYIVLLSSRAEIQKDCAFYVDTINACFLLISLVFLIIMAYLFSISIIPLRRTIKAAREYADGNFSYVMPQRHNTDEFRELSDTISFMASELQKNEDYQHKLIANISHDFRSPLTSIKGYAEAMMDGTIPPEMYEKYLKTICFETERLTKLTTGILELNNFDINSVRLDLSDFDINRIIKHTAETFEGICTRKRITLRLTFEEPHFEVTADEGKIQQVLYNLIDNAVKFSSADSFIDVSVSEKGSKCFISVKDYGRGIPKDKLKRIWERFYKIDNSRGKDKKGSGLGLAIVKEIISMHSENINVISTEGVGTEFIFTLPKAKHFEE